MYVVHCKPYENTCMRLISKTQRILAIKYTAYQLNKMQLYNTVTFFCYVPLCYDYNTYNLYQSKHNCI